ncbi:MAG: XisI protein [Bacteroidia bacterium]
MDQVNIYKSFVKEVVLSVAAMTPSDEFSETQSILDDERGHYVLIDIGWNKKKRTYLPFLHIDVKSDGKVWIQHDGTDIIIAEQLAQKGIPKSEIVLGFRAPHVRPMMEDYAVE